MKFIHIADVHWGMNPDSDRPWSRERAQAIRDSFAEVVRQARLRDADCLFISGDLFHRQPLLRDLKEVNYLFSTIPGVRVVIIAGNHDRIRSNSALMSFTWCPNVTFLMSEELSSVYFKDLNLEAHGFSYHTADAALGHIHKPELAPDFSYAYPGSLEPLDKTETGPHGMVVGEIQPASGQVISLEFVPVARTQYIPLVVHVTPSTTNGELCDRITDAVKERGMEHIYRFRIRGMRDPDITFDLEPLERRLQIVEAVDESEPQYDFCQLFAEHPSDMIGFYIQVFQKEDPSPVEKKALYYGIDALLRTTDERS